MLRINYLTTFRSLLNTLALLLIVLWTSGCFGQSVSTDESHIIIGTWVIKSIYTTQNVEGPNPSQQKKLLGTAIVLNAHSLSACGQSVPIKSIKVNQISSADFLANTRARFSEVGVEAQSITEVVINDRQSGTCFDVFPIPGQDIYIKDKNEILIDFEGVFYRALRKNGELKGQTEAAPVSRTDNE